MKPALAILLCCLLVGCQSPPLPAKSTLGQKLSAARASRPAMAAMDTVAEIAIDKKSRWSARGKKQPIVLNLARTETVADPSITTSSLCRAIALDGSGGHAILGYDSQQANGSSAGGTPFGYYSTTTNVQNFTGTLTLAVPPTGPVSIRWGFDGNQWALTNGIWMFNPTIEYW